MLREAGNAIRRLCLLVEYARQAAGKANTLNFYVVEELQGIYRGMVIAIPLFHWQAFEDMSLLYSTALYTSTDNWLTYI